MQSRKRVENRSSSGQIIGDALPAIHIMPRALTRRWLRICIGARSAQEAITGLHLVRLDATYHGIDITWQQAVLTPMSHSKPRSYLIVKGKDQAGGKCWLSVTGLACGDEKQPEVWQTAMVLESIGFGSILALYESISNPRSLKHSFPQQ